MSFVLIAPRPAPVPEPAAVPASDPMPDWFWAKTRTAIGVNVPRRDASVLGRRDRVGARLRPRHRRSAPAADAATAAMSASSAASTSTLPVAVTDDWSMNAATVSLTVFCENAAPDRDLAGEAPRCRRRQGWSDRRSNGRDIAGHVERRVLDMSLERVDDTVANDQAAPEGVCLIQAEAMPLMLAWTRSARPRRRRDGRLFKNRLEVRDFVRSPHPPPPRRGLRVPPVAVTILDLSSASRARCGATMTESFAMRASMVLR